MSTVLICADSNVLAQVAAEHFVALAAEANAARGQFSVALSGGSTPRATYELLATALFADRVDWPRVHVFWGDERAVPPHHPASNYRLARETLFDHVPIPAGNVHRVLSEGEPTRAAAAYESELRSFFRRHPLGPQPHFDLVMLGMGEDGHTASLFPGTAALSEETRWVVAHFVNQVSAWRITLVPAVLNAARQVTFLVRGRSKAAALARVLAGDPLPAGLVRPDLGRVTWLVDHDAASELTEAGWLDRDATT